MDPEQPDVVGDGLQTDAVGDLFAEPAEAAAEQTEYVQLEEEEKEFEEEPLPDPEPILVPDPELLPELDAGDVDPVVVPELPRDPFPDYATEVFGRLRLRQTQHPRDWCLRVVSSRYARSFLRS